MASFILPNFDMSSVDIYICVCLPHFFSSQRRQQTISRAQGITPILKYLIFPVRGRSKQCDGFIGRYSQNRHLKFDEIQFNLGGFLNPKINSYSFQNSLIHVGKLVTTASHFV